MYREVIFVVREIEDEPDNAWCKIYMRGIWTYIESNTSKHWAMRKWRYFEQFFFRLCRTLVICGTQADLITNTFVIWSQQELDHITPTMQLLFLTKTHLYRMLFSTHFASRHVCLFSTGIWFHIPVQSFTILLVCCTNVHAQCTQYPVTCNTNVHEWNSRFQNVFQRSSFFSC